MEWIDEKKKMKIKKTLSYKGKVYSIVFSMLEDEIRKMLKDGYSKTIIVKILNEELETNINYFTFIKWFDKNIKQKNQNSNTLRKNTQKQKVELKKETKKVKENNDNPKNKDEEVDDEDWKSIIFPQIEEACEGMKKANLRI